MGGELFQTIVYNPVGVIIIIKFFEIVFLFNCEVVFSTNQENVFINLFKHLFYVFVVLLSVLLIKMHILQYLE